MMYKSERCGKVGTKEWWLDGWDKIGADTLPVDLWERAIKVYQLVEIAEEDLK